MRSIGIQSADSSQRSSVIGQEALRHPLVIPSDSQEYSQWIYFDRVKRLRGLFGLV